MFFSSSFPAFLTHISSILITVVTFAAFTLINDDAIEFNSSNVFAALALFNQLTVPLFIFPITIPIIISCLISTKRIGRFLSQPEIEKEFEGVRNMARMLCKSSESLDDDQQFNSESDDKQIFNKLFMEGTIDEEELEEKLLMEIKINDHDVKILGDTNDSTVKITDSDANCSENPNGIHDVVILRDKNNKTTLRKQNQLSTSTRLERNRLRSTTAADKHSVAEGPRMMKSAPPFKVPDEVIVCIKDARFSWDGENDFNVLEIDYLSIPKGRFCAIQNCQSDELIENFRTNRSSDGNRWEEWKR